MIKVLFICTGNVFRSMVAEKCLKNYLDKNNIKDIQVDSAGTNPLPLEIEKSQDLLNLIKERLTFHSVENLHNYKKLNKELVDKNDIIIAMNLDHQEYFKQKFNLDVELFNEIAFNKKEGVLDKEEKYTNSEELEKYWQEYVKSVIDYIYDSMPNLVEGIRKRMIKTYLFDLDDTLIDSSVYRISFPKIMQRIKAVMKLSDIEIEKVAVKNNIKKSEWGYDTGELCKVLGLLDIYYEILEEEIKKNKKLKFDVNKKFKELKEKRIQIGICSNSMLRTIKMQLDANDIQGYDFIFSAEDAGVMKNNKKYWQELIKKYNLKPEECLVIGDNEIDDKLVPSSLGFKTKDLN